MRFSGFLSGTNKGCNQSGKQRDDQKIFYPVIALTTVGWLACIEVAMRRKLAAAHLTGIDYFPM
ncbi:hypothetical protein WS62_19385 [Burkholderia sp. ABCPW 14]|nr:hypothetical protein WS62_19385 [Burkholderia sp. ABCPW 14]